MALASAFGLRADARKSDEWLRHSLDALLESNATRPRKARMRGRQELVLRRAAETKDQLASFFTEWLKHHAPRRNGNGIYHTGTYLEWPRENLGR